MQQTTNYNLLIPEGTDVVNPLTQVNPNFQTIDGAMFANKQASIGTASEVVTGTVHAIIRSNTDSDVFRFTATGSWTAGDTMTLDGQQVTVHLSDGTTPATNSYIIGAEVLAMVNGTLVTLAISTTPPAQGVTSFNSRTGAVVPTASDYDASMVDYDNTLSSLTSTDVQSAIDELATAGGGGDVQVYNDSPTLTPGTWVTLPGITSASLSNYDYIKINWTISSDSWYEVPLKVGSSMMTSYWVNPQFVDSGVTYRMLLEASFDSGNLKLRFNETGYTATVTNITIYGCKR